MSLAIKPRFNPELPPASFPFRPSVKQSGDIVLGSTPATLGCHDSYCRCRACKPSLVQGVSR